MAVDGAGNVYIADTGNNAIKEWTAANSNVTTLVSSGLVDPCGVAVDGAGNVYIADTGNSAIKEWTAANSNVTTLVSSGLTYPYGVAVDGAGNVYIADTWQQRDQEVDGGQQHRDHIGVLGIDLSLWRGGGRRGQCLYRRHRQQRDQRTAVCLRGPDRPSWKSLAAGNDALPVVLPATENLLAPFAPASDQSWLTITGITNGVVSFSFTANTGLKPHGPYRLPRPNHCHHPDRSRHAAESSPARNTGQWRFPVFFHQHSGRVLTVLSTTNLSLPLSNWTVAGTPTNNGSGLFQFTAPMSTNAPQLYYRVSSP